jgi:PKD repeat protein
VTATVAGAMDWGEGAISRSAAVLAAALVAAACLFGAATAGAVVVQLRSGHVVGIAPRAGVVPASIPGLRASAARPHVDNGNVDYQGGPVLHSSAPYLIFWDPPSETIPAQTEALMTRYFTDVAHDSGLASNVYGVLRQYSDQTGIADYQQTFSPAQAIVDTHTFPGPDMSNCVENAPSDESTCLTDAQLQTELTRFIAAKSLPTDGLASASELVANAPIYFIVTPADVNICSQGPTKTHPSGDCSDDVFCSYHGSYADGPNNVLYASIPLINALVTDPSNGLDPKYCQSDNNAAVQEPNGDGGDVAIKYMSHEDSETITDPLVGSGWYDTASGNEVGDNCNYWDGTVTDVAAGDDPNAFEPTLGGSASAGTLFDQLINGDQYYTQSEWSNGDVDCDMQPSASTLTPSFTVPAGDVATGSTVGFDPSATSSTGGYSSIAWSFGDGATSFASTATTSNLNPTSISHSYAAPGTYTVTLSVVDTHGNVATTTHTVSVANPPLATFTASTTDPLVGTAVSFSAAGSSDPNAGASIAAYHWSFGDGGSAAGPATSHAYAAAGPHTVTLTVTDSLGLSSSVSEVIDALTSPVAAFTFSPTPAVPGHAVSFSAAGSSEANAGGAITSYSWSFGDGAAAAGATSSHAYRTPGIYMAHLSIADSFGLSAGTTHIVLVTSPGAPTASAASLSGVGKGKPKLSFELLAGLNAPDLQKAVVGLPTGLAFAKKGLAKGVRVIGAGGQKLAFSAKLSHGKLAVTLTGAAGAVKLTIAAPAVTESAKLKRQVSRGKVKSLSIAVTAIDSAGTSTPLTLVPGV